jgi:hypothetical protein
MARLFSRPWEKKRREEDGEAQPFMGTLAAVGLLVLIMLVVEARPAGAPRA